MTSGANFVDKVDIRSFHYSTPVLKTNRLLNYFLGKFFYLITIFFIVTNFDGGTFSDLVRSSRLDVFEKNTLQDVENPPWLFGVGLRHTSRRLISDFFGRLTGLKGSWGVIRSKLLEILPRISARFIIFRPWRSLGGRFGGLGDIQTRSSLFRVGGVGGRWPTREKSLSLKA